MGAPKDESVDTLLPEPVQVGAGSEARHLVVDPSLLGKGNKERTGAGYYLHLGVQLLDRFCVGTASNGPVGADDPDLPASGHGDGSTGSGLDHPDNRNR